MNNVFQKSLFYNECVGQVEVDRYLYITKYARAAGGNWNTDATWSTSSGGAADTTKPAAGDDAVLDGTSGNVTIDAAAVCRSLDCTLYAGVLTHNAFTITIGTSTAHATNIALEFSAGMTYTITNVITSAIAFVSTAAVTHTVNFAGKTTGNVSTNGVGVTWQWTGAHNMGSTATMNPIIGNIDFNGQTCTWGLFSSDSFNGRILTFGAANITLTGTGQVFDMDNGSNLTVSAASAVITCTGDNVIFGGRGANYNTLNLTGAGGATISYGFTVVNLNRTGTATKTDSLTLGANFTVTGVLTLAGNSVTNRLLVKSDVVGTARTLTKTGATLTWSNVDFQDISLNTSFDASAITGNSGNCGGNTNITFTTAATQTWDGTTSGNWSTNAWTSRVPLPQDDVVISAAFSASQTVTSDMPRLGKSIDWTGTTGTPAWDFSSLANSVYGSITLISGMTISGTQVLTLAGRGSFTLTSAGKTYTQAITQAAPSGTYTLVDALSTAGDFTLANGTFTAVTFNVTCLTAIISGTLTRSLTMGTGTWSLTSTATATVWNTTTVTGLTFSGASSTIVISTTSANTRTFAGGARTYGTLTYTVAGSTGGLDLTGANTFDTINFSDITNARTLRFTAATTTTVTTFNVNGTAGKLMTIGSITASSHTLSKSSGLVSLDFLSISRSTAQGGASWYAGANSTNGGNNSGWIFGAPGGNTGSGSGSGRGVSMKALQNLRNLT